MYVSRTPLWSQFGLDIADFVIPSVHVCCTENLANHQPCAYPAQGSFSRTCPLPRAWSLLVQSSYSVLTPPKHFFIVPRPYPAPLRCWYNHHFQRGSPVAECPRFYRSTEECQTIVDQLKMTACPYCKFVGTLNRHGFLYGFDETSPKQKTVRAQRIYCSNRHARHGCGRTFSVWRADKIRRLSLTTCALLLFLQLAVTGTIVAASRAFHWLSERTWQRIWRRFDLAQSQIRTALYERGPPPTSPPRMPCQPRRLPAAQVLNHLQTVCPDAQCPITAFQHSLQTFFV